MSKPDDNTSDDEFQDAICSTKSNEAIIEELISKQSKLTLPDETEPEVIKSEEATDSTVPTTDEFSDCLPDDIIDEDALKELEELLTDEEKLKNKEQADKLKLEGNELFKKEQYTQSLEIYTNALKLCPTTYTKERAVLYANRAASKIKVDSKNSAIDDCSKAIELNPNYVRALMRRAKLYEDADKLDEALDDYKQITELEPTNRESLEALSRLPPLINERNEKMKEEMMDKLKDLGNMILKPFGLSTSNFQMQKDPATGSYSINFDQNPR